MFDNKIDPIEYDDEARLSHHMVSEIQWSKLTFAQKSLAVTIGFLIIFNSVQYTYQVYRLMNDPYQKLYLVEQNLPNYFNSLQKQQIIDFIEDYNDFRTIGAKTLFSSA